MVIEASFSAYFGSRVDCPKWQVSFIDELIREYEPQGTQFIYKMTRNKMQRTSHCWAKRSFMSPLSFPSFTPRPSVPIHLSLSTAPVLISSPSLSFPHYLHGTMALFMSVLKLSMCL